jgi:hypothetical protein
MQSQQSQHDIQEKFMILQRQIEDQNRLLITTQSTMIRLQFFMGPSASPGAIALGCVTLVDATGHHHDIPMNFCTSYQVRSLATESFSSKLTRQILFSNSMTCSQFSFNVMRLKAKFKDGI